MHSRVHAFLTHPRSLGGDTVPENVVGRRLIAKFPNVSIVSFIAVYGSKFTKFSTLVEHHVDCLP